jgi:4-hydroxybenzoate polyprenyltransferase/phosphoserine phosphatase
LIFQSPGDAGGRATKADQGGLPLCVDLDGTLIHTDSLHEALMVASRDLLAVFKAVARLGRGKAAFKQSVYGIADLDAAHLPYNLQLIEFLRSEHARGRKLFLVTAADKGIAEAVATELGFFSEVICSDGARNLRGRAKADVLVERFGAKGFCYAGNDVTDLEVWKVAGSGILVNAPSRLGVRARAAVPIEAEFAPRQHNFKALIKAMRPHQWAKNVLVFLPIVASTEFFDITAWQRTALLFVSFCCAASSIYIVNDLVDLSADRRHPRKKLRPFASGNLSVRAGLLLSMALAALALVVGGPVGAIPLVLGYAALSSSYSFVLKEKALVDVFILASLYTIRIFAGGVVSGHAVTEWLIGFAIFMFLSLALSKRVAELIGTRSRAGGLLSRRAYADQDIPILQVMGVAAAFVAALVLSLYLQSQTARSLYLHPQWLLLVVVAVLFWFARVWLLTSRGKMDDDPVVWAVKDRQSQILGVIVAIAMVAAIGRL